MTVSNTTSRNQYTATSGQTVFPYTFEIFDKDDVAVLKNGTLLSEGTNYTVSGVGNDSGGNITLTVGATAGDILTIYRDMAYQRLTDYQNSGDFLAQEVNDDFDRLWLAVQQNDEGNDRAIVKPITDSASIDMTLPSSADRANSFLTFDATGAPSVTRAGDPAAPSSIVRQQFTGDGATLVYTLASAPGALGQSMQVFIDGVYQENDTYTVSGTSLTFSEAPPLNASIETVAFEVNAIGETSSNLVSYTPAGSGAVQTTVQSKLRETVSVKDFGAVGDGVTDDTAAIQAISTSTYIPAGTYLISTKWSFGLSNVVIYGDGIDKTIIKSSTLMEIIEVSADIENVIFKDLTFELSTVNAVENTYGIFNSQNLALTNVSFERCKFTCPNAHTNGVKVIVEDASLADNVTFDSCVFEDIGRMGIEFQNHNDASPLDRFKNIQIRNCLFKDLGQNNLYGMGVSLSGVGSGCKVSENTFDNCYNIALEGVGVSDSIFSNNVFRNLSSRTCNPISFSGTGVRAMSNNVFTGNTSDGVFADGRVNIYSQDRAVISNNIFYCDYVFFRDVTNSVIDNNRIIVDGLYVIFMEGTSTGNILSNMYLDSSANAGAFSVIRFNSATTTGNIVKDCVINKSASGTNGSQINGALNNFIVNSFTGSGVRLLSWQTLTISDADQDFSADPFMRDVYRINGTLTAPRNITVPNLIQPLVFWNNTAQPLTIKTVSGSGEAIAAGARQTAYFDGTNIKVV